MDHLAPVYLALPKRQRGLFIASAGNLEYARAKVPDAVMAGTALEMGDRTRVPILVAASGDLTSAVKNGRVHRGIMEHGAGFTYGGDMSQPEGRRAAYSSSYAGGRDRPAELFLFPGPHPAERQRQATPDAWVEEVGCPKLDSLPARVPDGIPTVAFSFHWDTSISPETRSTFIYYREQLAEFARENPDIRVLGHGHPRFFDRLLPWYEKHGIEAVRSFDEVCRRADLYATDASSSLFEFASTGRPVLVLNAPFYRLSVDHGLRFSPRWSCPLDGNLHFCGAAHVGQQINEPYDIKRAVPFHLEFPDRDRAQREAALDLVYQPRRGAARKAARVLAEWARRVEYSHVDLRHGHAAHRPPERRVHGS